MAGVFLQTVEDVTAEEAAVHADQPDAVISLFLPEI
jgi:hypothetical protein